MDKNLKGKIKWFNLAKGYGFITSREGDDYYFPRNAVISKDIDIDNIGTGDLVEFAIQENNRGARARGPRATNVTIISIVPKQKKTDDRIICPSCGRRIIPRIVFDRGKPSYSICSFCGGTVKTFNNGLCFIATAVYGDSGCSQVMSLRYFRDTRLLTNIPGRLFVKAYYKVSPSFADWLKTKPYLAKKIRSLLDMAVQYLKRLEK